MLKFDAKKYSTTLKLIFLKAVNDIFPEGDVIIDNSLNNGIYGEIKNILLTEEGIEKISLKMKEIIGKNYPIELISGNNEELKAKSAKIEREDVRKLLDNSGWTSIMEYSIDGYHDYVYEKPYKFTGDIDIFELTKYNDGFILKYPLTSDKKLPPKIDTPKIAKVFIEAAEWNKILGVDTLGSLNEKVLNKEIGELIRVNEALHHKEIAKIAQTISDNKKIKLVTIAGPSSSGKTTFSKRLYIHLRANGMNPIVISLDNYYIGRANVPLDENGKKDFETIEALDLKLLNENLRDLVAGKEVEIPEYNFLTGEREEVGTKMKVPEKNGLIIIEGIHGLNERLTQEIPRENKFKIYISCLTQLNIDKHNRISTSDVREIRRLVRDSLSREEKGEGTLAMWASVRRGEEKHIFPYQEEADALFNSNLVYELGVLKSYALRELIKVNPSSPYYEEAKRIMRFLYCFVDIKVDLIPDDSILKEFIGGSIFYKY
ncbi:nucleoside kinase [uncultured Fusobacterium sp.]|uniref:uridine kinase family protein n=1 Tax=uncultured Fusobacterium sp. TaxID=159267 RepID=UPI0025EB5224|nr:nucleoside kinase [uncultured Fusobacterium sp.]